MMRKYAYAWLTLSFFIISFGLHWYFGWRSFVDEQAAHGQSAQAAEYLNEMARDTFENWQSEFLQLLWQVVGLAYFLYVGSPSSKENDDRTEANIDALMEMVGGSKARALIAKLDEEYERHSGHAPPHGHRGNG
jgi:cbb3-type cytochrome oxidase subunit 3